MASSTVSAPTNPLSFAEDSICAQENSVLFNLPGEVRDKIFEFALSDFEDKSQVYDTRTYWSRPQYFAPRRSDTRLLRTCKRAYNEGWFRPWTSVLHTFWLTSADRAPEDQVTLTTMGDMIDIMEQINDRHGYVELGHIRIFAQLWALEPGFYLQDILQQPKFYPRSITITLRHTDFWFWENDEALYIAAEWVDICRFPASTREICLEMETIDRKKVQVDSLAEQMKKQWFFRTTEDIGLFADDTIDEVVTWRGSSTFEGQRWVRDEKQETPGMLDYYVRTVVFRVDPRRSITKRKRPETIRNQIRQPQLYDPQPYIDAEQLEQAGISDAICAQEARDMLLAWRRAQAQERVRQLTQYERSPVNITTLFEEADREEEELDDGEDDENDEDYEDDEDEDEEMEDVEDASETDDHEDDYEDNEDLDAEDLEVVAGRLNADQETFVISSGPTDERPLHIVGPNHPLY